MYKTYLISLTGIIFFKIIKIWISRLFQQVFGLFVKYFLHYNLWFLYILVRNTNHKNCSAEIILKVITFTIFASMNHEKYCPFIYSACPFIYFACPFIYFAWVLKVFYCPFWLSFVPFFLKTWPLIHKSLSIFYFCPFFETFFLYFITRKHD